MLSGPHSNNAQPGDGSWRSFVTCPWFYGLLSCFLLLTLLACRLIADYDLGFHLKGGQWIVENRAFPAKDTFTYTVNGRDYIDLHWLYQVLLYGLYLFGGYSLLSIANIVLIILAFLIVFKRMCLTGAPLWICVVLLAAALLASEIRFQTRPEVLSWVYLGLTLWVLDERMNRRKNLLFLLPLIHLAWVNTQGLFAVGWIVMVFYLVSGFFHADNLDKGLLKYSGLAAAVCLLNPYFLKGAAFPFTLLATIGTSNDFKRAIGEFQSPWIMDDMFFFVPVWSYGAYKGFCVLLLLLLAATFRKRKLHEFLLAGSFFYLSAVSLRNIPLFMLACAPLAAACWKDLEWGWLEEIKKRLSRRREDAKKNLSVEKENKKVFSSEMFRPLAAWIFTALMLGLSLRALTNAYYISDRRYDRFGLGLDVEQQPIRAAEFLVQNRLDGKILNHLNCGGWLDWKAPQKTFIDGRLEVIGAELFKELNDSSKPGGLQALTAKYKPDILFFNPDSAISWILELQKMPEWRPAYLDESTVIYLKKGYAPQVPALDAGRVLEERRISPSVVKDAKDLIQQARPGAVKTFGEDFVRPAQYSMGLKTIGAYFYNTGKFDEAEAVFLENIRLSKGRYYDLFINLGSLYNKTGRADEARMCLDRIFQDVPRESVERTKKRFHRH
jgi:tetratricopeptide (TPR) repeat protein